MKKELLLTVKSRVGLIADLSFILGSAHINIEDIHVVTIGDKAIINLKVSDDKKALEILEKNGYAPVVYEGLVVTINNAPGELAKVSKILADNKIQITRMDIIQQNQEKAVVSFDLDKMKKAKKVLEEFIV
ncbi:MAG: ACT domain-containing protein [Candidatus Micrarchaeia archaeon]|jgi:hypothetical protein